MVALLAIDIGSTWTSHGSFMTKRALKDSGSTLQGQWCKAETVIWDGLIITTHATRTRVRMKKSIGNVHHDAQRYRTQRYTHRDGSSSFKQCCDLCIHAIPRHYKRQDSASQSHHNCSKSYTQNNSMSLAVCNEKLESSMVLKHFQNCGHTQKNLSLMSCTHKIALNKAVVVHFNLPWIQQSFYWSFL